MLRTRCAISGGAAARGEHERMEWEVTHVPDVSEQALVGRAGGQRIGHQDVERIVGHEAGETDMGRERQVPGRHDEHGHEPRAGGTFGGAAPRAGGM